MSAFTYADLQASYKTLIADKSGNITKAIQSSFHDQLAESPDRTEFEFQFKPDTIPEVISCIRKDFESKGWIVYGPPSKMIFRSPVLNANTKPLSLKEFCHLMGFRTNGGRYAYLSALYANTIFNTTPVEDVISSWGCLFEALPDYCDSVANMRRFVSRAYSSRTSPTRVSLIAFGRRSGTSTMLSLIVLYEAYRHMMTSRMAANIGVLSRGQSGLKASLLILLQKLAAFMPDVTIDAKSNQIKLQTKECVEGNNHVAIRFGHKVENILGSDYIAIVCDNDQRLDKPHHFLPEFAMLFPILKQHGVLVYANSLPLFDVQSDSYKASVKRDQCFEGVFEHMDQVSPGSLAVNLPTWIADTSFPAEFLAQERERKGDEEYQREYGAKWAPEKKEDEKKP